MSKYQRGIAAALLQRLESERTTWWVDVLMSELNATRVQVQGAANYLIRNGHPVAVVSKGTAWRYDSVASAAPAPPAPAEQLMFEQIGTTRIGDLILQDQNGNLYRATALD